MIDTLAGEIPGFQWENCCGGGRIKDYGAMHRAVKVFNSDTYSALQVRQAFYDSSYAFHPVQIEGHLGSTDGRFRPRGVASMKYAFRSASLGAPEWFLMRPMEAMAASRGVSKKKTSSRTVSRRTKPNSGRWSRPTVPHPASSQRAELGRHRVLRPGGWERE